MSSTIPGALAALTAVAADALPDLQIGRGSLINTENDLLIIGYDDENQEAVTGARLPADLAGRAVNESYDVSCLLSVWTGDADDTAVPLMAERLFGYFDALDSALALNPRLNESPGVGRAYITQFSLSDGPDADEEGDVVGTTATLRFIVHIDAWRNP